MSDEMLLLELTSFDQVTTGCGTPDALHPIRTSSPRFTSSNPSSGIVITDGGAVIV